MNDKYKDVLAEWEKFSRTISADFMEPGFTGNGEVLEFLLEQLQKRELRIRTKIIKKIKFILKKNEPFTDDFALGKDDALEKVISIIKICK